MSWSVLTAQDEDAWFNNYLELAIGEMPPQLPPEIQTIGSTKVSWWEGPPGKAVIISEGGNPNDQYLAEQIVLKDLEPFGYKRAYFSFTGFNKTAAWQDVMMKAVRIKNTTGRVQIATNQFNYVEAQVIGDHGEYEVTIKRDDPNSRVITQWTCECPWSDYAFDRTRKWKKYEGRCCSHVLAVYWQSLATPLDDYDLQIHGPLRGQKRGPNKDQMQMDVGDTSGGGPRGGEGGASPGGVPKGFDISDGAPPGAATPGGPDMPNVEAPGGTPAPAAPAAPSIKDGPPAKPPKPSPARPQGQQEGPGGEQLSLMSDPGKPTSQPTDTSVLPPSPAQQAQQAQQAPFSAPKFQDETGGRNQHLPGALSKVIGKVYKISEVEAERSSPFDPESEDNWNKPIVVQLVKASDSYQDDSGNTVPCEYGIAEGGSPEKGAGSVWPVGINSVGLAFGYDYRTKWVTVHFPLHKSGPLEPHHVSVTLNEDKLALRPDVNNPFKGPR